jgi:endonuclease/exonuclease/phosphatase family metal-dependent hydrolase
MPLSLATFNVKNLLEPRDGRERAVLPAKLDWIARLVRTCDADVVGLQEIGPPELLDAVVDRLERRGGYGQPIVGTPDARGIRCALLSRAPVVEAQVHTAEALSFPAFREGDPPPFGARIPLRRGVVHARVAAPGTGEVDVLVAHFKSSRPVAARDADGAERPAVTARARAEGALRSLVWRAAEALHVRSIVDAILVRSPAAHVAVVGDLNDGPDSIVARILRADRDDRGKDRGDHLLDCAARVEASARYSALHEGRRSQIDHILASAGLYARLESAAFLNADLREHPAPDAAGNESPTVDSDHAPLVARFG